MKFNNKTLLAILALFIVALSISSVSASDVTDDINIAANSVNAVGTTHNIADGASLSDIQTQVDNANAGDTISFANKGQYDFGNNNKAINVNKTLTFIGNGATIKALNGFYVSAAATTTIDGTSFDGFKFINPSTTWNGRAIDIRGGSDISVTNCNFTGSGHSGVYIQRATGNILVENCYFSGTADANSINPNGVKETGTKAVNIMGGNGVRIINNTVNGPVLDAFSIASNSKNILVKDNKVNGAYYAIFYGGGLVNITTKNNTFENIRAIAISLMKSAQSSVIENNTFIMGTLPENGAYKNNIAIYLEQGNTAHGAATQIGDIYIKNNKFSSAKDVPDTQTSYAVEVKSQGGPLKLNGDFEVTNNKYDNNIVKFLFLDGNWNVNGDDIIIEQATMDSQIKASSNNITAKYGTNQTIQLTGADGTILTNQKVDLTFTKDGKTVATKSVTTNSFGTANFVNDLDAGYYTVSASYAGATINGVIYSQATAQFGMMSTAPAITSKPVIVGNNMTLITKTGNKFTVLLKDENGKILAKQKVNFTICLKGSSAAKTYTLTTDENGFAGLNINLMMGEWSMVISINDPTYGKVTANYVLTAVRNEAKIVAPSVIITKKGQLFKVRLVDQVGSALGNQKVTIHLGTAKYVRTTDANGYASLPINLANNKLYNIFLSFAGTNLYTPCTGGSQITTKY